MAAPRIDGSYIAPVPVDLPAIAQGETETIPWTVADLPVGIGISAAQWAVKSRLRDVDADALLTKTLSDAASAGVGQILDDGAITRVARGTIEIAKAESAALPVARLVHGLVVSLSDNEQREVAVGVLPVTRAVSQGPEIVIPGQTVVSVIATSPDTSVLVGASVDIMVRALDVADAPLAGKTVTAVADSPQGTVSYPNGQITDDDGEVVVRVTGVSDGLVLIDAACASIAAAPVSIDVVAAPDRTLDWDLLNPAERGKPALSVNDLIPRAWYFGLTQAVAEGWHSNIDTPYLADPATGEWRRKNYTDVPQWTPLWSDASGGNALNGAAFVEVTSDSPYRTGLQTGYWGSSATFSFPVWNPAAPEGFWDGQARIKGPAISTGFSTKNDLTRTPEGSNASGLEMHHTFWIAPGDASNIGKQVLAFIYRGTRNDVSFALYHDCTKVITLTDGWQRVVLGPYHNLGNGAGGYSISVPLSEKRATLVKITALRNVLGPPSPDAELDSAYAVTEGLGMFMANYARNACTEEWVNLGYESEMGNGVSPTTRRSPIWTEHRPIMMGRWKLDPAASQSTVVGDQPAYVEKYEGRADYRSRYIWLTKYIEPDDSGWMPSDTDLRFHFTHATSGFTADGYLTREPWYMGNQKTGGRVYSARLYMGPSFVSGNSITARIDYQGATVKTCYAMPSCLMLEQGGSEREFNSKIPPVITPIINLFPNDISLASGAHGGVMDAGMCCITLDDITQYLDTEEGVLAFEWLTPFDPYQVHLDLLAQAEPTYAHFNLSDAGPGGANVNAFVNTFETDSGGSHPHRLRLKIDPGIASGGLGTDPNNGNYHGTEIAHPITAVGQVPAHSVFRILMRWKNFSFTDYKLETAGLNSGVGQWYDAATNVAIASGAAEPATPADPTLLTWNWDDRIAAYFGANALPVRFWIGADRDITLHSQMFLRRVATSKAIGTRRQWDAWQRQRWGTRAVFAT